MSRLVLTYLPLRARAESIRMVLHYGNIQYEDRIIPFDQFKLRYKDDKKICPFGQLPSLMVENGEVLAESGAIVRYLAKIANIYPSDPLEAAKADMMFDLSQDMNAINPILNFYPVESDKWKELYETYFKSLPFHLGNMTEILGDKPFFCGEKPNHGDFALLNILINSVTVKSNCLDDFPKIKEYVNRVSSLPEIDNYLKTRLSENETGMPDSFMQKFLAKSLI
jgi:glutathione S-transferase